MTLRTRALTYTLAAVLIILGALGVMAATTPRTTDFFCLWTGSRIVAQGGDPYSAALYQPAIEGRSADIFGNVRAGNCAYGYFYPFTTAIVMLPLGVLPLEAAAIVWEILIFAGAAIGLALIAKAAGLDRTHTLALALFIFASQMFYWNVVNAQFGGVMLLAMGLLASPHAGVPRSVAGLGLTMLKPHALTLVPIVRALSLDRRSLAAAVVVGALVLLASVLVRPGWLGAWIGGVGGQSRGSFDVSVSLWRLETVLGVPGLAVVLVGLTLGILGVAAWRARPLDTVDALAVAAIAWQVIVPYGLSYDQLAPIALASASIMRAVTEPRMRYMTALLFIAVVVVPWPLYSRGEVLTSPRSGDLEVLNSLVPVVVAVLLAFALAQRRRQTGKPVVGSEPARP